MDKNGIKMKGPSVDSDMGRENFFKEMEHFLNNIFFPLKILVRHFSVF